MDPKIRIHNRIGKRITFLNELEGIEVGLGVCRIRCVEATKVIKVSQREILRCCRRHETSWKIRVLVNGEDSGLMIAPADLLNYTWIVFSYDPVDDGSVVLKAKGLSSQAKGSRGLLHRRWSFGLGLKRHREYRMHEEMYGFEDISEARKKDEPLRSTMEYYSLEYQEPVHVNNIKTAHLSTGNIKQETKLWENAIVGYIAAEDMKDYDVKQFVNEHWKNFGPFNIYELKPPFFLFDFTNQDGKRKVLEYGQWFVSSRPFILKRWTPNLVLDPNCFVSTLPVWVRFPDLNLGFWSSDSIAKVASVIGKPLFTDEPTALKKNLQYARVCIEVNPVEKLPNNVQVSYNDHSLIFGQRVEYEWTPQFCRHCQSLLHDSSTCILAPNGDICEQPWDDGIHGETTTFDSGNEINASTGDTDTDAQTNINICNSTSGANDIQGSYDSNSQKRIANTELPRTANIEVAEDSKYSATTRLLGSGRSASKRWLAYGMQKATSLVGRTNSWISIIYDDNILDS